MLYLIILAMTQSNKMALFLKIKVRSYVRKQIKYHAIELLGISNMVMPMKLYQIAVLVEEKLFYMENTSCKVILNVKIMYAILWIKCVILVKSYIGDLGWLGLKK